MSRIVACLFGGMELRAADGRELSVDTRKARALLAFLMLEQERWHSRTRLAALLWGDREDSQARNSLNQALYEIRKIETATGARLVERQSDRVRFVSDSIDCDAHRFEALLASDPIAAADLSEVRLLERLDLAESDFTAWLDQKRAQCREKLAQALRKLAASTASEMPLTARLDAARRLIALEPLDESARRQFMVLLAESGDRAEAIRQYEVCAALLRDELGLVPDSETRDVLAQIRRAPAASTALPLPDKPSIAVLPFQNMSGDPGQEYFADGMVEEIITALSRFKSLFVIARNSSFTYKGKAVDIKQVGRELGVRYVLEGSVRKAANQVRITGQLVDSQTGGHLWADRFDSSLENLFELQDQITTRVVAVVAPRVDLAESERAKRRPSDDPNAYDCFLRGTSRMHEASRSSLQEALSLFHHATRLDPEFSTPFGMIARCHSHLWGLGWSSDEDLAKAEIRRTASRVALIGKDDAAALCAAGFALVRVCEEDETGAALIDQGLAVNMNLALGWAQRGGVSVMLGEASEGVDQLNRAMRLNPIDPEIHWVEMQMSYATLMQGDYNGAIKWANKSLVHRPNFSTALWSLVIAQAISGRVAAAQKMMPVVRENQPAMRLSNLRTYIPMRKAEHLALIREGLRLAGLPE